MTNFHSGQLQMEQHLMKQAQGGGTGPFWGGCLTNQHLGFQVSSLHKNTCPFSSGDVHEQLQRHERLYVTRTPLVLH